MSQSAEQLASEFPVPGLRFESGAGGLVKAMVQTEVACGEVFLHGAHVTQFTPRGHKPVLWMSKNSLFEIGKPIRGGVPICFPWFGPHATKPEAPAHGLARTSIWELTSAQVVENGGIALTLAAQIESFALSYRVVFGDELQLALRVALSADAKGPEEFEEALHTYFAVSDIRGTAIGGLEQVSYVDKVAGASIVSASGEPIRFEGECDRVYLDTESPCELQDSDRAIRIAKSGSKATVVWNPWIAKSVRMPDFGDDEWPGMVCVESANVAKNRVRLAPGQSHEMLVRISVH